MDFNDADNGYAMLLQSRRDRCREYDDLETAMLMLEAMRSQLAALDNVTERPFKRDAESKRLCDEMYAAAQEVIDRCKTRIEWMDSLDCDGFDFYTRTGEAPFYTEFP